MKVTLNNKSVNLGREANVSDALIVAKINPETVLVKRDKKLIPHDEPLKENDVLELVTVISGG